MKWTKGAKGGNTLTSDRAYQNDLRQLVRSSRSSSIV